MKTDDRPRPGSQAQSISHGNDGKDLVAVNASRKDKQLAALKDLRAVYHRYGNFFGPNNRKIEFTDDCDDCLKRESLKCKKAFFWSIWNLQQRQDKAQRLLLASGFSTPDHWLNLNIGEVGSSWKRDRGTTVSIHSVDEKGLDLAAKEISLAILRLESEPRCTADERLTPEQAVKARADAEIARVPFSFDESKGEWIGPLTLAHIGKAWNIKAPRRGSVRSRLGERLRACNNGHCQQWEVWIAKTDTSERSKRLKNMASTKTRNEL
jgi:hypothetical protein